MRKIETLLVGTFLITIIIIMGTVFWQNNNSKSANNNFQYEETKYGAFLAAQHAIYINDFENAAKFSEKISDLDYDITQSTKLLSEFLSGKMPEDVTVLKEEKATASRLIYDAYLVKENKWEELYKRHKKDESALAAPLRIWSSIATSHEKDAMKFIENLPTNESWKNFVRGQIYAEKGDIKKATDFFEKVRTDFMNINDYLYVMSFYNHNDLKDEAENLKSNFIARPGGMFMSSYDTIPDWSIYSGYNNELAFSLVQNVSHTQIMMYSDLAILLLRFAQITGDKFNTVNDAINYYIGQFFYTNNGNYEKYFKLVKPDSPFYLFATLRIAEKNNDIRALESIIKENSLFVPAVNELISYHIKNGNKRSALRVVNSALNNKELNDTGRAFFLKSRAQIYFVFDDFDLAQKDLHDASLVLPLDTEILSLQSKIWVSENREIETAYDYAMMLIKQNPADIMAWDTLGRVVAKREGVAAALEVLSRVGEVSASCSSLFDHLGDLYIQSGDKQAAKNAYLRAIELSDDGLVIVSEIKKKLRKIK